MIPLKAGTTYEDVSELTSSGAYELSIEKANAETHYILADVSWSGQWAWNRLAPELCATLKRKEPRSAGKVRKKALAGSITTEVRLEGVYP